MTPVYIILAIAILLLVLYATWRPVRSGKLRRANMVRPKASAALGNTEMRMRTEAPPLDYPAKDVTYRR